MFNLKSHYETIKATCAAYLSRTCKTSSLDVQNVLQYTKEVITKTNKAFVILCSEQKLFFVKSGV